MRRKCTLDLWAGAPTAEPTVGQGSATAGAGPWLRSCGSPATLRWTWHLTAGCSSCDDDAGCNLRWKHILDAERSAKLERGLCVVTEEGDGAAVGEPGDEDNDDAEAMAAQVGALAETNELDDVIREVDDLAGDEEVVEFVRSVIDVSGD